MVLGDGKKKHYHMCNTFTAESSIINIWFSSQVSLFKDVETQHNPKMKRHVLDGKGAKNSNPNTVHFIANTLNMDLLQVVGKKYSPNGSLMVISHSKK